MNLYGELYADGEGRSVSGRAVVYGDSTGVRGSGRHVVQAGGLTIDKEALATLHHMDDQLLAKLGEGLVFNDSPTELRVTIDMPEGVSYADDALRLIRKKRLNGLSLELAPEKTRQEGDMYVIEKGIVHGISVVPRPAFGKSRLDKFASLGQLSGMIPIGQKLGCECSGGADCHSAFFQPGAFESLDNVVGKSADEIREMIARGEANDVLAVASNQSEPLGALSTGSLSFTKEGDGIAWRLAVPDTTVGHGVVEGMGAVSYYGRPYLSQSESVGEESDGTFTWSKAVVRMLIVSPTDRSDGWIPALMTRSRENNAALTPMEVLSWA